MTIRELVNTFISQGFDEQRAKSNAAQEILLRKIASSSLKEHIILKGGVVMYNLSNNQRRSTMDVDFDLIRYDILRSESIDSLIDILNKSDPYFSIKRFGDIVNLHHQDYKGVRVVLLIFDKSDSIKIKVDIGIHTLFFITQNRMLFFENSGDSVIVLVNPPEQIVSEKLYSLYKHGELSQRYKDVFDVYYLINNFTLNKKIIEKCIEALIHNPSITICNFFDIIEVTLKNPIFIENARTSHSKWIDDSVEKVLSEIIDYITSF